MSRGYQYTTAVPTLSEGQTVRERCDVNGRVLTASGENANTAALITLTSAGVGTTNGSDQTNTANRGVLVGVNITALTGTAPTVTVTIQGKDAASGVYYTLLASAAIVSTGFTLLTIYPGATAATNTVADKSLPMTWRVIAAVAGTSPAATATVGACVVI